MIALRATGYLRGAGSVAPAGRAGVPGLDRARALLLGLPARGGLQRRRLGPAMPRRPCVLVDGVIDIGEEAVQPGPAEEVVPLVLAADHREGHGVFRQALDQG